MIAPSISSNRAVSRSIRAICLFSMPAIIAPPFPGITQIRHSERSGPIFSSAPYCDASGRAVEESLRPLLCELCALCGLCVSFFFPFSYTLTLLYSFTLILLLSFSFLLPQKHNQPGAPGTRFYLGLGFPLPLLSLPFSFLSTLRPLRPLRYLFLASRSLIADRWSPPSRLLISDIR